MAIARILRWMLAGGLAAIGAGWLAQADPAAEFERQFSIQTWTVENGLPINHIGAIAQTPDGYLWVGTLSGLARFDGNRAVIFNSYNTPALINHSISALCVSPEGDLWIGTPDGLVRFASGVWTRFTSENGLPSQGVWDLAFDSSGKLWLVSDKDLCGVFPDGPFHKIKMSRREPVPKLIPLLDGSLAMIGAQGPIPLKNDGEFRATALPVNSAQPVTEEVNAAVMDSAGLWCLAGMSGLWRETRDGWQKISDNQWPHTVPILYRDREGTLWAWLGPLGLARINGAALESVSLVPGAISPAVTVFFEDREGNFGIGTERGLFQLRPRLVQAFTKSDGLGSDVAWSLAEAPDGSIWALTESDTYHGNLVRIDPSGRVTALERGGARRCILVDHQGTVWVDHGEGQGMVWIAPTLDRRIATTMDRSVQSLYLDRQNRLWAGTDRGPNCFVDREELPLPNLPAGDIRVSYQAKDQAMWFGSKGQGLFRWSEGKLEVFSKADGLADDRVFSLHEDADGFLWIGTHNGLSRLQISNWRTRGPPRFVNFATRHGLLDNLINHLLEDDQGFLWFSCNRGIFRIARTELNDVAAGRKTTAACAVLGARDGMPNSETNGERQPAGCKARDGRLWFPTQGGVVVLDPKRVNRFLAPPQKPILEHVEADGQTLWGAPDPVETELQEQGVSGPGKARSQTGDPLELGPGSAKLLKIRFAAPTFVYPERVVLEYRLEPHDPEWRRTHDRERDVSYPNLRPGSYQLHLRARNSHGLLSEVTTPFAFRLAPYFYQTWPFYIACGAASLCAIAGVQAYRLRAQRRLLDLQRQHALDLERARIARDIHDDLGSRFSQIAVLQELADRNLSSPDSARAHLQKLRVAANDAFQALDEIVWAANPKQDSLEGLVSYLREYVPEFLVPAGIQCKLEFPIPVPQRQLSAQVRHQLFLVIKEALQNVVKHSSATVVNLQLEADLNRLSIVIADNGCGFAASSSAAMRDLSAPNLGNGLFNMRQRIDSIGGHLEIQSHPGQGTRVRLQLNG